MTPFYEITGALRLAVSHLATSPGDYFILDLFSRRARGNGNERRRMFTSGRSFTARRDRGAAAVVHAFNPRDHDGAGMLSLNS